MLCWLFVAVSAGWYDYQLWGDSRCQTIKERGMQFESGTEIVPGQPNPCYHRTARFLRACVRARLSMVFAGAPGSGKTTLLTCCAAELDPSLRIVVAEEVFECDVPLPNVAHMQTRPARADRPEVDLRRLVAELVLVQIMKELTPDGLSREGIGKPGHGHRADDVEDRRHEAGD